jgi:hypothetical protein
MTPVTPKHIINGMILLGCLVIGSSREGHTSRITYDTVDLNQLIAKSTLIVEAECQEESPLSPSAVLEATYTCRVKRTIYSRSKASPAPEEAIVVHGAGWSLSADLERIHREQGVWKSAPLDRFRGEHPESLRKMQSAILFLIKGIADQPGYELAALNGFVAPGQLKSIKRIVAALPPANNSPAPKHP